MGVEIANLAGSKPWVLLTNDDGVDSPALWYLLGELSSSVEVRAVVPAGECSWTGKILSRLSRLELGQVERDGFKIWTLNGYPADCANVGIHNLFDTRPALVVSGINMGANAGLAYFLSSGTVGAAIEGILSGIPAAAFSAQLLPDDYSRWWRHRQLSTSLEALLRNTAIVSREIVEEVLRGGLPQGASLLSVNMPPNTTPEATRRIAALTTTEYGSFFHFNETSRHLEHGGIKLRSQQGQAQGDIAALERGEVAITPIRFALSAECREEDRRRFEDNG